MSGCGAGVINESQSGIIGVVVYKIKHKLNPDNEIYYSLHNLKGLCIVVVVKCIPKLRGLTVTMYIYIDHIAINALLGIR